MNSLQSFVYYVDETVFHKYFLQIATVCIVYEYLMSNSTIQEENNFLVIKGVW